MPGPAFRVFLTFNSQEVAVDIFRNGEHFFGFGRDRKAEVVAIKVGEADLSLC